MIGPINRLSALFAPRHPVVYSLDWHPPDHVSFFSNRHLRPTVGGIEEDLDVLSVVTFAGPPPFNQTLWPDHCVQGTQGARLHRDLKVGEMALLMLLR